MKIPRDHIGHIGNKTVMLILIMSSFFSINGLAKQGAFFSKKKYLPKPLPIFSITKDKLPSPIFDEDQDYIKCYWKAWELAFQNFHEPKPTSGFVSQFIDAAFNENIFLWDTCFLTMFCNYSYPYVPGISSLDNFYAKQHEDGEICREINRTTGKDFDPWVNKENKPLFSRWGYNWSKGTKQIDVVYKARPIPTPNPKLTLDSLNHPIFAWAELESYRITADKDRLKQIWLPLEHYYSALKKYLRQGNGLYMTDSASMDNATRNPYLESGGTGIDISSEMALFARNLAEIGHILGKDKKAEKYESDAEELSFLINKHMWDCKKNFYFDLTLDNKRAPVKSIAAFWALLAKVASKSQAEALVAQLNNSRTFKTVHRVPTLAADEHGFNPEGGYWNGAIWAPTEKMIVQGLENYGYTDLAHEIALNHLHNVVEVYKQTGTLWENYAPQSVARGKPSKGDFVGWTGIGPIAFLIEYIIGIRANAPDNVIIWHINTTKRVGIENFWFGEKTISLVCEEANSTGNRLVKVKSTGAFHLRISLNGKVKAIEIPAGKSMQVIL
ncbi:MAG TPA: trehalase family glycosidase [Sedimentisphaerales bacterium]|nr:trehalase family glycosidase [Sedimentisphaerales bacterium]